MAYILKTDGTIIENCKTDLASLQAAVGGLIQIVGTRTGLLLVINEEGKLNDLPVNPGATDMYKYGNYDKIVGDVVVCNQSEIK